jgi:hypothetical protein
MAVLRVHLERHAILKRQQLKKKDLPKKKIACHFSMPSLKIVHLAVPDWCTRQFLAYVNKGAK